MPWAQQLASITLKSALALSVPPAPWPSSVPMLTLTQSASLVAGAPMKCSDTSPCKPNHSCGTFLPPCFKGDNPPFSPTTRSLSRTLAIHKSNHKKKNTQVPLPKPWPSITLTTKPQKHTRHTTHTHPLGSPFPPSDPLAHPSPRRTGSALHYYAAHRWWW